MSFEPVFTINFNNINLFDVTRYLLVSTLILIQCNADTYGVQAIHTKQSTRIVSEHVVATRFAPQALSSTIRLNSRKHICFSQSRQNLCGEFKFSLKYTCFGVFCICRIYFFFHNFGEEQRQKYNKYVSLHHFILKYTISIS